MKRFAFLLTLLLAATASAETFTVANLSQLQKAFATTQPTLDIVLTASIKLDKSITFPAVKLLRVFGKSQTCGLDFKGLPIDRRCNGSEINSAGALFFGITVKNFEPSGAAVKFNGAGGMVLVDCTFSDISTQYIAPTTQPKDASDVHYGHAFTSHGTSSSIRVVGCTFRRVCKSSGEYSHALYIHCPEIAVVDCTFDGCAGGVVELVGEQVVCVGNTGINGVLAKNRYGFEVWPVFAYIPKGVSGFYSRNRLAGNWRAFFVGAPDADDYIDGNDYSGAILMGPPAVDLSAGKELSRDEWKGMGFDIQSKWPAATH